MPTRKARILFVGNSFTTRNDLPSLLAGLAGVVGKGTMVEHEVVAAGGASLRQHLNSGKAAALLERSHWNYVVLQEQSTLPIKNAARMHDNVRDFHSLIDEAGAETVLYMTWARHNAPKTQADLTAAYDEIGAELGAVVVPAGVAWEKVLAKRPGPVLHDKDGSHPSLAGSYLAACVFQWTLFGEPVGIPDAAEAIPEIHRKLIHDTAKQVAKNRQ